MSLSSRNFYLLVTMVTGILHCCLAVGPQFSVPGSTGTVISISESSVIGKSIYRVIAIDGDGDTLTYSIAAQIPSTSPMKFAMTSATGVLTTAGDFDYDTEGSVKQYELTVRANDGVNSIDTSIAIRITDDNDNSPYFINLYHVTEDALPGSYITTVKADDIDSGNNGIITFEIMDGNQDEAFAIGATNGQITVAKELNFDTKATYHLVVKAKDGGSTPRSATMTLTVNILDGVDNGSHVVSGIWSTCLTFIGLILSKLASDI